MLKLPKHIEKQMKAYRMGAIGIPQDYIEFHKDAAYDDLMKRSDWTVLEDKGLVSDGWCDGAVFLSVVIAYKDHFGEWKVAELKWHESGAWFARGAAWTRFAEMKG